MKSEQYQIQSMGQVELKKRDDFTLLILLSLRWETSSTDCFVCLYVRPSVRYNTRWSLSAFLSSAHLIAFALSLSLLSIYLYRKLTSSVLFW